MGVDQSKGGPCYKQVVALVLLLLLILAWPVPLGWLTVLALLGAAHAHHLAVDGGGHAVVHLAVDLGQGIAWCRGRRGADDDDDGDDDGDDDDDDDDDDGGGSAAAY